MSKTKQYVVVNDAGKHTGKAIVGVSQGEGVLHTVSSLVRPISQAEAENKANAEVIHFSGQYYEIGTGNRNSDLTKANEHHLALVLRSIAQVPNGSTIETLILMAPLDECKNATKISQYKNFVLSLGQNNTDAVEHPVEISFNYQGEERHYTINETLVYPESSGFVIKYMDLLKERFADEQTPFSIIDIGGLNVNAGFYDWVDGDPELVMEKSFSINGGINAIANSLQSVLGPYLNGATIEQAEKAIRLGKITDFANPENEKKSIELIQSHLNEKFAGWVDKIQQHDWPIAGMAHIFVGGGSVLLEKAINEHLKALPFRIISPTAAFDNVVGAATDGDLAFRSIVTTKNQKVAIKETEAVKERLHSR